MNYVEAINPCFGKYEDGDWACSKVANCYQRVSCALPYFRKAMAGLTLEELPKYLTDDDEVVRRVAKERYGELAKGSN